MVLEEIIGERNFSHGRKELMYGVEELLEQMRDISQLNDIMYQWIFAKRGQTVITGYTYNVNFQDSRFSLEEVPLTVKGKSLNFLT